MRALLATVCVAAALVTGCSDKGGTPQATATPTVADPYTALTPPTSPGVGSFDASAARRAYLATQGLLATSLLEPGTLTGSGTASLLEQLAVPDEVLSVKDLLVPPTKRGLDIRPLFARTVTLAPNPVEVVRSSYTADEVANPSGQHGIRIGWDGALRYRVLVGGVAHQVAYVLHVSYVFGPVTGEPGGLQLMQVVPGSSHATPVVTSCLAKGVLLPADGVPSSSDFGPGPWLPPAAGPTCPV